MSDRPSIVRATLRALLEPKRLAPTLLVCGAMLYAQSRMGDPKSLLVAVGFCLVFMLVAPVSWRALFAEPQPLGIAVVRLGIYGLTGVALIWTVGRFVPFVFHVRPSFLTLRTSLVVITALYWVGGWGLARDIGLEHRLVAESARADALAREAERAQLLALRAHLDPHFLFNTLNAIAEWCRTDGETAERAVLQLSAMLREVLAGVKSPSWPLARELELTKTLFALHQLRDPALFQLELDVAPEALEVPVPPMILLPLAENAVKHGPAKGHRGTIALKVSSSAGAVNVLLENPGAYQGPREGSDGLPTLERRLALAYDGAATHRIFAAGDRTRLELSLPRSSPREAT